MVMPQIKDSKTLAEDGRRLTIGEIDRPVAGSTDGALGANGSGRANGVGVSSLS